ncbi:transglycosylase domain-containing protein [Intrasporangium sp.]|uniref:transglycosylase domain-containing protein n=1 Tax=Intrasporangium sp. TaxID=1925024 RepID=UPI0032216089
MAHRNAATRTVTLLTAFVGVAVLLGVLAAGVAAPPVAALGRLAQAGDDAFNSLPSSFTVNPLAQGSRILAADGSVIATPQDEYRIVVPLSKVAPIMRQAQVAIEDSRFYEHGPVDPEGIGRALLENLRTGAATQGASTLTQQFVKLSLQAQALAAGNDEAAQAATAKTLVRKLIELRYAIGLEQTWTKDQILQGYLNIAYYGDGAYGVEAASRHYFDVPASRLSLTQAATLAGLVQSPSTTDPVHHPKAAQARRDVVLDRMHELGIISDTAWAKAKRRPMKKDLHVTEPPSTCAASPDPYFCQFVIAWLMQQPALGRTEQARHDLLYRGGLTIRTTLEPKVQQIVDKSIREVAPERNGIGVSAAAYVTEPGTGKVLAFGQNTQFGLTSKKGVTAIDYSVDKAYGGSGGFQFGSTAKAFALVTAMKQGLGLHATVDAPHADAHDYATFTPDQFPQPCGLYQPWHVYNDTPGGGRMSLMNATAMSTNTAFVALAERLGVCHIRDTMLAFGMHDANGAPIGKYPPQVILGAQTVSPQTLANAYAAIAADGTLCQTYPVTEVLRGGKPMWQPKPSCQQVEPSGPVKQATQYLMYNMTNGSGIRNQLDGRPSAGKTGTADGNSQSWFVGFTPQLATAVWVGNPTDPTRRMFDVSMAGKFCASMTGACYAAPIWKRIMNRTLDGEPVLPMP